MRKRKPRDRYREKIRKSNIRKRKQSGLCAEYDELDQKEVDDLFDDFMKNEEKKK